MVIEMSEHTTIWLSKKSKKIIQRFCEIHRWKIKGFMDELASTLRNGIDMLEDDSVPIETLRQLYEFSDILVCSDVREIGKPIEKGE